jgi:hypothetical protein
MEGYKLVSTEGEFTEKWEAESADAKDKAKWRCAKCFKVFARQGNLT